MRKLRDDLLGYLIAGAFLYFMVTGMLEFLDRGFGSGGGSSDYAEQCYGRVCY